VNLSYTHTLLDGRISVNFSPAFCLCRAVRKNSRKFSQNAWCLAPHSRGNSRLKQRFVTKKRVHLTLSTDENSFDLERGEAGWGKIFRYLRSVKGESELHTHTHTHTRYWYALYLAGRIRVNFFPLPFAFVKLFRNIHLRVIIK
jgi:hypothetical protein